MSEIEEPAPVVKVCFTFIILNLIVNLSYMYIMSLFSGTLLPYM